MARESARVLEWVETTLSLPCDELEQESTQTQRVHGPRRSVTAL